MQISHNAQVNIFDQCRGISAAEAARREGIPLKLSGSKEMARCPFHCEKTASLTFYEDGHYHCYGCGAHGDAVSFVARLRGIGLREAAERLLGHYGGPAPPPPPKDKTDWLVLMAELEAWHKKEWRCIRTC